MIVPAPFLRGVVKLFDVLDFIDSPSIRAHNRNTVFSPAAQAVLIANSCKVSLEEKIVALEKLVSSYTEEAFSTDGVFTGGVQWNIAKFYDVVKKMIALWKQTLAVKNESDGYVYAAFFREKGFWDNEADGYFSNFDKAYRYIEEEKQYYVQDEDLCKIENFAYIQRIKPDTQEVDRYDFNNNMCLFRVWPCKERYIQAGLKNEENLVEDCFVSIPLPFKKGDILKLTEVFYESYYGVLLFDTLEWNIEAINPDGTDMKVWLGIWDEKRGCFNYSDEANLLGLSFADDIPKETLQMLNKISCRSEDDSLDILSLLRQKEVRAYYRNKTELSVKQKMDIVTGCYKSLSDKTKLLNLLVGQVEEKEKRKVRDMLELHEQMTEMFYYPARCYPVGDIFYVIHKSELPPQSSLAELTRTLVSPETSENEICNNIQQVLRYFEQCEEKGFLYYVDIVVKSNGKKSWCPVTYSMAYIEGKYEPFRCFLDMEYAKQIEWQDALECYQSGLRRNELPFKSSDRVQLQLPFMSKPIRGVLWREQDGNQNWYTFLYPDGTDVDSPNAGNEGIDLSYQYVGLVSGYAVIDWLERVED